MVGKIAIRSGGRPRSSRKTHATQRLACVLFADLVGYSRMMEQNQQRTIAAFASVRDAICVPTIKRHGGRLIKTTGDGFLAEFEHPIAGVSCAIVIQRAMVRRMDDPRLAFRMGIHLGDVVEEGGDLYGHNVNVAARLQSLSDPEGLCLSEVVHDAVFGALDERFDDGGLRALHNIEQPMRIWRWRQDERIFDAHFSDAPAPPPLPSRPSLAVLPFNNFGQEPDQEYFADGLVEEIITALAKIRWLFIIARNSSFAYRNRSIDVRQISRDLGVRYIVEGSVRRLVNEVRITAQLIDGASGVHLWAEAVTGQLDRIFELQADVAARIAGAIEPKLRSAEIERARRKPTRNLDAYDCYLRMLPHVYSGTADDTMRALMLLGRALALDPDYALAHAMRGWCRTHQFLIGATKISNELAVEVATDVRKGVALDPMDAEVLSLGSVPIILLGRDYDAGQEWIGNSLRMNPNSSTAWSRSGLISCWTGQYPTGAEHFRRAMRLSPADPLTFQFQAGLGTAYLFLHDWAQAISWCRRALANNQSFAPVYRILAVALVQSGSIEEARAVVGQVLAIDPLSSLSRSQVTAFRDPEAKSLYLKGLRQAGLPE